MKRSFMRQKAVEWQEEAARIASSQPFHYGSSEDGMSDGTMFSLTGQNAALWARATIPDRRAVVEAFATNSVVSSVAMVNAYINDELGQAWGAVLQRNRTVTSLNLESNSITSGGMLAIAEALRVNSSLVELKLSNQHLAFSQQSEMAIAEALEGNGTLMKLTIELRSSRARELMNKYLQRNQDQIRQQRRATAGATSATSAAMQLRAVAGVSVADWAAEAERIGTSQPPQYGDRLVDDKQGPPTSYVTSGSALWSRATGRAPRRPSHARTARAWGAGEAGRRKRRGPRARLERCASRAGDVDAGQRELL